MGCASSKQARLDRIPVTPLPRSHSLPIRVHHPAQRKGDSYHVVALTSSTLGSLKLESFDQNLNGNVVSDWEDEKLTEKTNKADEKPEFLTEVVAAKTWSDRVERKIAKIPKTPTFTPPNEPETINAWELMEGLEDNSPLRTFSFHAPSNIKIPEPGPESERDPKPEPDLSPSPKPVWLEKPAVEPVLTDFDPEIISNFRKALDELSPCNTSRLRSPEPPEPPGSAGGGNRFTKDGSVQAKIRVFQQRIDEGRFGKKRKQQEEQDKESLPLKCPPHGEDRVVVYFTSLRGVRKTYEDCCRVRLILRGLGVRTDERDVSMHQGYREELYEIFEESYCSLPRVFVKGVYVGSAEEVRQMHEAGELEKLLEGCEVVGEGGGGTCHGCGDVRFVPCCTCDGSCKVYVDYEDDCGGFEGGFQRCPDCNENGVIQCPVCCQ